MTNLTDAERDELHHAVLRDVIAAGETVPNVFATAESILAARVQAERDRLLARIEAYALLWQTFADGAQQSVAAREGLADAKELADYSVAMTRRVRDLRALVAEERAR